MNIVIVEDEQNLAEPIILNLELDGYEVVHFSSGLDALDNLKILAIADLVILDIMLPEISGIEICEKLRKNSSVPVLFLSAKGTTADKILGLRSGGTDYLSKPFDLEELLLRVDILTQRAAKHTSDATIIIGKNVIDLKTYLVTNQITKIETSLSKREVNLLQLFAKREGEVISRNEILDEVWGEEHYPTSRTIDNFILNFRKLFEENPKNPIYFHSIRGVGYRFTNQN